jgi:pimeloyl-ACP methyl ester carboxylesterase
MLEKALPPVFVQFPTPDGLTLPGLLYRGKKDKAVVIYLHGNGSSSVFYDTENHQPLALALAEKKISILNFNNRGAHIIKRLNQKKGKKTERKLFGMAYEKIKECVYDIDGAIAFLRKQGYTTFYLAGASTGANKICVYNYYKSKNEVSKCVLLCGADDTGIYYQGLGKSKFWKLLATAKKKIKSKKGEEIIKELLPQDIFSYQGFWDIANPDGDYNVFPFYELFHKTQLSTRPLFRHFRSIKKPSLVIYGDQDEFSRGVPKIVGALKGFQPRFEYRIIKGADHRFSEHKKILARTIANWLV